MQIRKKNGGDSEKEKCSRNSNYVPKIIKFYIKLLHWDSKYLVIIIKNVFYKIEQS